MHSSAKALLASRQRLAKYFRGELFADPALSILLDLLVAEHEGKDVTIGNCCIAAGVPATTAMRHIRDMTGDGILCRRPHPSDGRSSIVELRPDARNALQRWIDETVGLIGPYLAATAPVQHAALPLSAKAAHNEVDRRVRGL